MTGGEAAAAAMVGKVVKHTGEQMAEEHKSVNKELLTAAKDSPHIADAANNYAKRIAIRQAILTRMYMPIAKLFGVANEYFEDDFDRDMAEKLKDVPEENLVPPKASLAAPAMQHLGFSLDEPNLKEMYLNLLATASDNRRKDEAHPSFVEVIKQLSSDEATLLHQILNSRHPQAIVAFHTSTKGVEGNSTIQKHVLPMIDTSTGESIEIPRLATFVDNWIRLGLVEVDYGKYLTKEGGYDWAMQRPEAKRHLAELHEGQILDLDKGFLGPTDFGLAFADAVGA